MDMNLIGCNGKALCVEGGGGEEVNCRTLPSAIGPWESLEEVPHPHTTQAVALRIKTEPGSIAAELVDYLYASAQPDGALEWDRDEPYDWEAFEKEIVGGPDAQGLYAVAYKSVPFGRYICCDLGLPVRVGKLEGHRVVCNRIARGPYETFVQRAVFNPLSRHSIMDVHSHFQGLTMDLGDMSAPFPWFEYAITGMSPRSRTNAYATKHSVGDTHCAIAISWNYPGYPIAGADYMHYLSAFRALCAEIRGEGFIPIVDLAGAGQGYNGDGWTYGHAFLMSHMNELLDAIDDPEHTLIHCGTELMGPGGDWTSDQIDRAYMQLRQLNPNGVHALWLGRGYAKWKNEHDGRACWNSPEGQTIDVMLNQLPQPITEGDHRDGCEQMASCLLGPTAQHIKPPNQLSWYLADPTPRGPRAAVAWEFATEEWVKGRIDQAGVDAHRDYLRSLGFTSLG